MGTGPSKKRKRIDLASLRRHAREDERVAVERREKSLRVSMRRRRSRP